MLPVPSVPQQPTLHPLAPCATLAYAVRTCPRIRSLSWVSIVTSEHKDAGMPGRTQRFESARAKGLVQNTRSSSLRLASNLLEEARAVETRPPRRAAERSRPSGAPLHPALRRTGRR